MDINIWHKLAAPFPPREIDWRAGSTNSDKTKAMALAYVDARAVMDRLDEVLPGAWQDEYTATAGHQGAIRNICRLGVCIDGQWLWRSDGAGDTDQEGEKGGLSDAFKRAAVKFGVGRYLYGFESPWVPIEARGRSYVIPSSVRDGQLYQLAARPFYAHLSKELSFQPKDMRRVWWAFNEHLIKQLPPEGQDKLARLLPAETKEAA